MAEWDLMNSDKGLLIENTEPTIQVSINNQPQQTSCEKKRQSGQKASRVTS